MSIDPWMDDRRLFFSFKSYGTAPAECEQKFFSSIRDRSVFLILKNYYLFSVRSGAFPVSKHQEIEKKQKISTAVK
jgi:hypothetical protein